MPEFKLLDNRLKFEGRITTVYESDFLAPNGEQITREITRHPEPYVLCQLWNRKL